MGEPFRRVLLGGMTTAKPVEEHPKAWLEGLEANLTGSRDLHQQ